MKNSKNQTRETTITWDAIQKAVEDWRLTSHSATWCESYESYLDNAKSYDKLREIVARLPIELRENNIFTIRQMQQRKQWLSQWAEKSDDYIVFRYTKPNLFGKKIVTPEIKIDMNSIFDFILWLQNQYFIWLKNQKKFK